MQSHFTRNAHDLNWKQVFGYYTIKFNATHPRGHQINHDDVIKWKHFQRYWPFVWGIHRSPVNSPHKGQWRGALMFSLIWAWINCLVNNREAVDLRRHPAHYGVIVMMFCTLQCTFIPLVAKVDRHNLYRVICNTQKPIQKNKNKPVCIFMYNIVHTASSSFCFALFCISYLGAGLVYSIDIFGHTVPNCLNGFADMAWSVTCALQWRHNGLDGVSNHQPHDCLLSRLFGRRSKKTSKLRVTGLCAEYSPVTGEFPAQMASNAEKVSIWWRRHVNHNYIYTHTHTYNKEFSVNVKAIARPTIPIPYYLIEVTARHFKIGCWMMKSQPSNLHVINRDFKSKCMVIRCLQSS